MHHSEEEFDIESIWDITDDNWMPF
jgi:hypothetical protein